VTGVEPFLGLFPWLFDKITRPWRRRRDARILRRVQQDAEQRR
jgi:hypothetical protein